MIKINKVFLFLLISAISLDSCKKDNNTTSTPKPSGSTYDLIRDSVYLYTKEDYYWYDALPAYDVFNPRSFTGSTELEGLQNELNKLSQYKINPATSQPYEYYAANPGEAKYSFIDEGEASGKLNAVSGDFGFAPLYNTTTDLRVKYVYPGSPADLAGIKRGYRITAINGTTNLNYDGPSGSTVQLVINAYSNSSTITMTLQRPDGTTFNATLNAVNYTINPVITSNVIDLGNGNKVGYIVFNSFVVLKNAQPELDAAFKDFQSKGVNNLVVDLRYNGGGYVETAEYLANLIAPASASGQIMYTAYYNDILTSGKSQLLKNQVRIDDATGKPYNFSQLDFSVAGNQTKFGTSHPLNLNQVFFIVTGSTASASELTINSLRPYMKVQLVGRTTYGKPVGFFDIKINKYEMYVPEFETKNAAGQGGYYTGMTPGTGDYAGYSAFDDPTKEFGDSSEGLLSSVLSYIKSGSYKTTSTTVQSINAQHALSVEEQRSMSLKLDGNKFNGMIYRTLKHK